MIERLAIVSTGRNRLSKFKFHPSHLKTAATAHQHGFHRVPASIIWGCHFLDNRTQHCDLRVDFMPLGTSPGGGIKAFVMSDASQHLRAKLKELIERASTAAEINFKKGREVAPLGFAIRENGSRFAFKPIPAGSGAEMSSMIRATFAHHKVVRYVLTVAASSEGKRLVLFSAEDESGMMVGRREIIMQPTAHLGPLEIIDSDIAEGRFVGLLPHEAPFGTQ
jgi:hypothetical protein